MNKVQCLLITEVLSIILILGYQTNLVAQNYLGIGWHLGMPVKFDNCCNALFQAYPFPTSSFSLTFKTEHINKNKKKWHYEIGLTTTAMGFTKVEHENDTLSQVYGYGPWTTFKQREIPFPSILYGMGRNVKLKNNHELLFGLEASFRWTYVFGGSYSRAFTLDDPSKESNFPLFLRANIGYTVPLKLLKQIPAHLLFYSKISAQNIAKGGQYIQDPITGVTNYDGKYRLNNSEAGIQFYVNLGKEHYNFLDNPPKPRKPKAKRTGKSLVRLSVEQQLYASRPTQFYVPQVDSFSLKGHYGSITPQISLKAEFVHFRNRNWATVVGFGTGRVMESRNFKAKASYSPDGAAVKGGLAFSPIGRYLIQNIGLSYKHDWGKRKLQHTLTASITEPVEKYASGYMLLVGNNNALDTILTGEFHERFFHHKVLFGIEYSPEFLSHVNKRVYFGLGMVFNYSWGQLAQGRVTISNGKTTYYGGMVQQMGKIGFTARMGFQGRRHFMGI